MKTPPVLLPICALLFSTNNGLAKGEKFKSSAGTYGCTKFDVNKNGILDPEERNALLRGFAEGDTALKTLDVNNDGKLDDNELAAIKLPAPAKQKKKKKTDA